MLHLRQHHHALGHIHLFDGFSEEELDMLQPLCTELHIPAGTTLIREGEIGHEMAIVLDGRLAVSKAGEPVATVTDGGVVGELALITGQPRNATVVATTDATVVLVDGRGFRRLLDDVPHLAARLLPLVAERLQPT